ncbi:MAG: hypothetical protein LBN26_04155 [Christensenellaceae bacterium]|jgi:hypothetical protein|nr:hypothetical protein [Christensenellaceae bacterium]
MIQLDNENLELLRACLNHYKPELLQVIESKELVQIDSELGNKIRQSIGNEFCREGMELDSEPNEYGIRLENLIDIIGEMFLCK